MTKEEFVKRYKVINIEKQENILIVGLYINENRDEIQQLYKII